MTKLSANTIKQICGHLVHHGGIMPTQVDCPEQILKRLILLNDLLVGHLEMMGTQQELEEAAELAMRDPLKFDAVYKDKLT